jgi:hypothetical protein
LLFELVIEGVEMRSLCESFIFLVLVLFVPATFVGCSSQLSVEEAAEQSAEDADLEGPGDDGGGGEADEVDELDMSDDGSSD